MIGELNNVATTGKRVTTDVGTQTRWYEKKTSRPFGGTKTSQGKKAANMNRRRRFRPSICKP